MDKLPKDILIKLLATIQDPEEMKDTELDTNISKYIHEKLKRNLKQVQEKLKNLDKYQDMTIKNIKVASVTDLNFIYYLFLSKVFIGIFCPIKGSLLLYVYSKEDGKNILKHYFTYCKNNIYNQLDINLPKDEKYQVYCDFVINLYEEGYLNELLKII
jgi:hypothetical protein